MTIAKFFRYFSLPTLKRFFSFIQKKLSGSVFANLTTLGTLIFAIYSHCSQNKEIEEQSRQQSKTVDSLNYRINALHFQPILKIAKNPVIESLSFESKIPKTYLLSDIQDDKATSDTLAINGKYTAITEFRVFNDGESLAKILAYVISDTLSELPIIRKYLHSDSLNAKPFVIDFLPDFSIDELQPGDTTSVKIRHEIKFPKQGRFTIHILMLYENQMGILYDTYFWAVFENLPTVFRQEFRIKDNQLQTRVLPDYETSRNILKCTTTKPSYDFYDLKQAQHIKNKISRLFNNLK